MNNILENDVLYNSIMSGVSKVTFILLVIFLTRRFINYLVSSEINQNFLTPSNVNPSHLIFTDQTTRDNQNGEFDFNATIEVGSFGISYFTNLVINITNYYDEKLVGISNLDIYNKLVEKYIDPFTVYNEGN